MNILQRFSLEGKTAIVTGGGTGLGRGFALALAEAGADVAVSGRTAATIDAVATEIGSLGRRALAIPVDVRLPEQVDDMVDAVVDAWGRLDIGVNNAGTGGHVRAQDLGEEDWARVIDTNLKGPFLCSRAEARVMRPHRHGKIINIGSMLGSVVNRTRKQAHYMASKAGLIHLSRSLASEWAPFGINVNSISPGFTMAGGAGSPENAPLHDRWRRDTPLGRMGEVADLQGAVVFLASEAAGFITGLDLVIDGGYTIW